MSKSSRVSAPAGRDAPARGRGGRILTVLLTTAAVGIAGACGPNKALYAPTPELLDVQAPDSFLVAVETSEGRFTVKMRRHWSPEGVDRVWHLMDNDFYAGARIYRVVDGFVAQWGFSGDPVLDSIWREHPLPDEPTVATNARGIVSFARGGPESRSYTLFVNLADNDRLDRLMASGVEGYPPIGEIEEGLEVIDGFYAAYADRMPSQDSIRLQGNEYLRRAYPQLDSIVGTRITGFWGEPPGQ
jgi:cyclophilin family peptidyl-prolyl cis-trans isomerase